MDKFDYITATIEEERDRLLKIISYLKEANKIDEINEYQERYNNILKYLNAKDRYYQVLKSINLDKEKLEKLNSIKDEYEVDNILLEDTLLSRFNEDTLGKYRNILYEDIKNVDIEVRDILYLLMEKQSNYSELVIKRSRLKEKLDRNKYPNTYNTLISQDILIEKQSSVLDQIFIVENNIKILGDKLSSIESSVMTDSILKILYEFWIIDSYDINKVNRNNLFKDNRSLINIKNDNSLTEIKENNKVDNNSSNIYNSDLKLPGIDEEALVNIDGRNYIE